MPPPHRSPEPRLRQATNADAAVVTDVVRRAYAHYPGRLGFRPPPMDSDYGVAIHRHEVWLAERPGNAAPVVGVLVLETEPDHLYVANVAVVPEAQRGGVGRRLLALAARRASERGLGELRLMTHEKMTENRAIYARLGWVEAASADGLPEGVVAMRLIAPVPTTD